MAHIQAAVLAAFLAEVMNFASLPVRSYASPIPCCHMAHLLPTLVCIPLPSPDYMRAHCCPRSPSNNNNINNNTNINTTNNTTNTNTNINTTTANTNTQKS